jgi:crotonobetainyl-CoA:carnitine CoA-transferase CaiB-like acyl-CoA transferase
MTGRGALDGLKVVDLTLMLAGPFCTQLLADQGADVVKIEPLEGEMTRTVDPFLPEDELRAFGGYFQSVNRNKRSVAIDLKQPQGKQILLRLIDSADVVVENFRAGVMERLGLSFETLIARNPRLVYAAIRGFGDPRTGESPYSNWPAFDVVSQAMGGVMGITGPDADTPVKVGPGVGDLFPAALAAFGIVSAVHHATRTGHGQFVDVSMVDSVLALCERIIYQHSYTGEVARPQGNGHPLLCPFGMFQANDGWVTIACPTDAFWISLCKIMKRDELATDPRFDTPATRLANAAAVNGIVTSFTRAFTKSELATLLGGRVPFGPVYDARDILHDPHFVARQMLAEVEVAGTGTSVKVAGTPIKMTLTPGGVFRRAPLLGEDTREVLVASGYSDGEIASWRNQNIIL